MKRALIAFAAVTLILGAPLLSAHGGASDSAAPAKDLPFPGEVFAVAGQTAFLIPASGEVVTGAKAWVWYAPTLPGLPGPEEKWMFEKFREAGIAIAGIDVGESYGSPAGRRLFTAFYSEMTGARGYGRRPVLLGRSRGGLMALSWAAENPEKVAGFAGIYPVCNLASYPGIAQAAGAYAMQPNELQAHLREHNPVDRLTALARSDVPLFAIHGDSDQLVPLQDNSALVRQRYAALGGKMELVVSAGQGHNMWSGFFQCQALVDFVKQRARAHESGWSASREGDALDPAIQPDYKPYDWPNDPPADYAGERSARITGISFTGRYANYTGADTWYPSWAPDGELYSTWTDGYLWTDRVLDPLQCGYCDKAYGRLHQDPNGGPGRLHLYHCHSNVDPPCTGQAKLVGSSPLNLEVVSLGKMFSGQNLYPCVNVIAKGVFYIGSYDAYNEGGRFNGFRFSRDWDHWTEQLSPGWRDDYWTDGRQPQTDFFASDQNPRRFNVPHAVVFGKNNQLSPDGEIYLSAHGQLPGGKSNWDKGDAIYLARVEPRPEAVTNSAAYEFFAGDDPKGEPTWTSDVTRSQPILQWRNHLGSESITYIPALRKYLLTTARLAENETNLTHNVLIFWESDRLTGPYRLVHYLRNWGPQAYFPNIPAKFISNDGLRMWLCVAANYASGKVDPFSCRYAASFHELVLHVKDRPVVANPTEQRKNVAPEARIEVSSLAEGYAPSGINDRMVGGIDGPRNQPSHEWASSQGAGAWVKLTWPKTQRISKVRLFDRPNQTDWVRGGTLTFSDGSTEKLRAWLSNRALAPGEVSFPEKKIQWLKFTVDAADGNHVGLAEIEVYATKSR